MVFQYKVIDEFNVNGSKILVLDKRRKLSRNAELQFELSGEKYPYSLTHNDFGIITPSTREFKGELILL